jgi:hypothetical protein
VSRPDFFTRPVQSDRSRQDYGNTRLRPDEPALRIRWTPLLIGFVLGYLLFGIVLPGLARVSTGEIVLETAPAAEAAN